MGKANSISAEELPGKWADLNKQLAKAKSLLRVMTQTVADIEDARTIELAKKRNAGKQRIPWSAVKKELG